MATQIITAARALAATAADGASRPSGGREQHPQDRRVEHRVDREAGPEGGHGYPFGHISDHQPIAPHITFLHGVTVKPPRSRSWRLATARFNPFLATNASEGHTHSPLSETKCDVIHVVAPTRIKCTPTPSEAHCVAEMALRRPITRHLYWPRTRPTRA